MQHVDPPLPAPSVPFFLDENKFGGLGPGGTLHRFFFLYHFWFFSCGTTCRPPTLARSDPRLLRRVVPFVVCLGTW